MVTNDTGIEAGFKVEHSTKTEHIILDDQEFPLCHVRREQKKKGLLRRNHELLYVHFDGIHFRVLSINNECCIKKITK